MVRVCVCVCSYSHGFSFAVLAPFWFYFTTFLYRVPSITALSATEQNEKT